jgi:separase
VKKGLPPVGAKTSLDESVARSRDACFLKYLNGAAVVVYGVPAFLD